MSPLSHAWLYIINYYYINIVKTSSIYTTINSNDGNYIFVASYETFYGSQEICNTLFDTTLASIHSDSHLNEIYLLLQSYWKSNSSILTNTWIGLTDEYLEGFPIWIDGQPLNYSNLLSSTNNHHFDCITMQNMDITWYPYNCQQQYTFICNAHSYWTKPIDYSFLPPLTPYNISMNGMYMAYNYPMTWVAADAYCQRLHGTHLATIDNDIDAMDAQLLCNDVGDDVKGCWIGLNRAYSNNIWEWSDGYSVNNHYYRWKLNANLNNDCIYLEKNNNNINTIYSWNTYYCHNNSNLPIFLCNTYLPSNSPSISPSVLPTDSPSFAPTIIDMNHEMIEMDGFYDCLRLTDNIAVIHNITYYDCVYIECLYNMECKMVNYISNSKTLTDSRCYIFEKQCIIHNDINNGNKIAIKGYKDICIDFPINWSDKQDDKCYHYEQFNWCIDGGIDDNITMNEFISHKDNIYQYNAIQVCCECGGGVDIFDNVTINVGLSVDHNTNNQFTTFEDNLLCTWPYKGFIDYRYKYWNNLQLFDLCTVLRDKILVDFNMISLDESIYNQHENDLNCDIFIDEIYPNINDQIIICNFNEYNNNDTYFILMISMDSNQTSTIYINSDWINITQSLLFKPTMNLTYSQCKSSIESSSNYALYGIIPCDINPIPQSPSISPSPTIKPFELHVPTWANPTVTPTFEPTVQTTQPTIYPTSNPITNHPTTSNPTYYPTYYPTTSNPTTSNPTSMAPTLNPTAIPTLNPTTSKPSAMPTNIPSIYPSKLPTNDPTVYPTPNPTMKPSNAPTVNPSKQPTSNPSDKPTNDPTIIPTLNPSKHPTSNPSKQPTLNPSKHPTSNPTMNPTITPSNIPTIYPSNDPTPIPTIYPTIYPTNIPSIDPTKIPSNTPSISPTISIMINTTEITVKVSDKNNNNNNNNGTSKNNNDTALISTLIIVMMTLVCLILCTITIIGVFCWGKFKITESERKQELNRMQFELASINRQSHTDNNTSFDTGYRGHISQITSDNEIFNDLDPETKEEEMDQDDDEQKLEIIDLYGVNNNHNNNNNPMIYRNHDDDDDDEDEDNFHCIICLLNAPNMFNYPCGHTCFCNECADQAIYHDNKCPNCRQRIIDCKQIYNGGFQE